MASVEVSDLDHKDWANPNPKDVADSDPDAEPPSELDAALIGEPISIRSSSD